MSSAYFLVILAHVPIYSAVVLRGLHCVNLAFEGDVKQETETQQGGNQLLYGNVTMLKGESVDLRVTTTPGVSRLGLHGRFGQIDVEGPNEADVDFEFVDSRGNPVNLSPCVHFSVLGIDNSANGPSRLVLTSKDFAQLPYVFFADQSSLEAHFNDHGKVIIKPRHHTHSTDELSYEALSLEELPKLLLQDDLQDRLANSVRFTLHHTSHFRMTFRTPDSNATRTYFFGGHVPIDALTTVQRVTKASAETTLQEGEGGQVRRPNIIWVMADDLGYGEVQLYPSESKHLRIATPFLDQFGREGMRFTNAYSGYSVCAPSRTAFFTGLHVGQFRNNRLDGVTMEPDSRVLNLAQMLQNAGYWTGAIGKISPLVKPLSQGFDRFIGKVDQSLCHDMYPDALDQGNTLGNYELPLNKGPKSRELCMANPHRYNYTTDVFHKLAVTWVTERARFEDTPFFLYLAYTVPHAGGYDRHRYKGGGNPVPHNIFYATQDWKDIEKDHASSITYMDQLFGQLMRTIKDVGIDDNTIVFFASDNGAHREGGHNPDHFNATGGLRGEKRSIYEGGVRSPTMVRWPGHITADTVSDLPWAFWDVLPTFADIVGCDYPAEERSQSISIAPTLFGRYADQVMHSYMYFTWGGGYSVRMGRFKGVVEQSGLPMMPDWTDTMQLFDLENDPFETKDVSEKFRSTVFQMKRLAVEEIGDGRCYQCEVPKEWRQQWEVAGFSYL